MASASQSSEVRTASRCTTETARGTHTFQVADYSLVKDRGANHLIRSATFAVGGHDWCIRFYPECHGGEGAGYVGVYLQLIAHNAMDDMVRALFSLSLVDQTTGLSCPIVSLDAPKVFSWNKEFWGNARFMKKSTLEASPYLKNDCLLIECCVTVIKEQVVMDDVPASELKIEVPPSDLSVDLGKLLESEEGADVTFKVSGEVFLAHKIVLGMRSPVFKAQLTGAVGESNRQCIVIEDIQPAVFRMLLHFIYTDSLPAMDGLDGDEKEEMVKHLLVAADKYAMERMKLICESMLCDSLGVESVATNLALADQHNCSQLKDACIGFINSVDRMNHVAASQGYEHLKRACPSVIVDLWEKVAKSRKV